MATYGSLIEVLFHRIELLFDVRIERLHVLFLLELDSVRQILQDLRDQQQSTTVLGSQIASDLDVNAVRHDQGRIEESQEQVASDGCFDRSVVVGEFHGNDLLQVVADLTALPTSLLR